MATLTKQHISLYAKHEALKAKTLESIKAQLLALHRATVACEAKQALLLIDMSEEEIEAYDSESNEVVSFGYAEDVECVLERL